MKKLLFFIIVLFTTFSTMAQVPKWDWAKADTASKISNNAGHTIAATHNRLLWGELQKKRMTYGPAILGDHKLSEYDSAGNYLNSTSITGKFHLLDAQADNAGNWYVLGQFFDTVNFPGGIQYVRDPYSFPTGSDYFIFRLNSGTLSLAWTQHIGSNTYSTASAFTITNNSLYIIIDSVTTYICKIDLSSGNRTTLWPQTGLSRVSSIAADNDGNIYVAGSCSNDTISFNGHVASAPYSYNSYIVRYKASGAFDWVQWMDDVTCTSRSLSLVSNNFIYYSGQLNDSMVIGSFHLHAPQVLGLGYMAARLDSTGNVMWAREQRDTSMGSVSVDNVYTAAVTNDSCLNLFLRVRGMLNFGNGVFTSTPFTHMIATIVCIKPDSTTKWVKYVNGLSTSCGHIISSGKDLYVTGSGYDSTALQFDTIAAPVTIGGYTPYLAKLNVIATTSDTTSHGSYVSTIQSTAITIAPNPATKQVSILGMEVITGKVVVQLTDVYGKTIFAHTYTKPQGREILPVGEYPRGLYFLEIKSNDYQAMQKIILQ